MTNILNSLLIALILFAVAPVIQAAGDGEKKSIVVGVLADFPPLYVSTPEGKPGGFSVETFDLIAREAGLEYRYRLLDDWDAMLASLRIGEIDVIPNLGITAERASDFAFSSVLEQIELGLFIRASDSTISGIAGLDGRMVSVIEHNAGVKWIQKYPNIEHRIYKNPEQGLLALISGDVDGFVYPMPIVEKLVKRIGIHDQIRQVGTPLLSISRAVAVHESRKELLEGVNNAITTVVDSAEYQAIEKRWHDNNEPVKAKPDGHSGTRNWQLLIIALLLLAAVIILWQLSRPGSRHSKVLQGAMLIMMSLIIIVLVTRYNTQQGEAENKAVRIAVVHLSKVDSSTYAGFLVKMKELGYRHGSDIEMIYKGAAGSIDRLDALVHEKLALQPDLILVSSTPGTMAVKRLTEGTDIPVVFAPVNDPVDAGIVPSLQYPQGHITGVRLPTGDDLRLQWLSRFSPQIRKIYVPYTEGDKSAAATLRQIRAVAPQLGVELITHALDSSDMIAGENSVVPDNIDAIYLPRDSTAEARIGEFAALAIARKLPLCAPSEKQVLAGALFSYGFVHYEIGRQAGQLVDQILRGTRPADLPVLTAENYLLLNMKVAQRIGIEVPELVLHQANRLIY